MKRAQVHDEVILEGPVQNAEAALKEVEECMGKPFTADDGVGRVNRLSVELAVDAKFAENWYKAK